MKLFDKLKDKFTTRYGEGFRSYGGGYQIRPETLPTTDEEWQVYFLTRRRGYGY